MNRAGAAIGELGAMEYAGPVQGLQRFPHFMVVGPQRTGTTWLYRQLDRHPHVFLPTIKELHFFNMLLIPGHVKFKTRDLHWYLKQFRDSPRTYLRKQVAARRGFGMPYRPRLYGECTASYAVLSPEMIRDIVALRPELRVVLMVRDPVERGWSHAVKDLVKRAGRKSIDEADAEQVRRFLADPYQLACGHYTAAVRNWREALRPGHLFVGCFEELTRAPETFLAKLLAFFELEMYPPLREGLHERVNPSGASTMPDEYRRQLEALFADERARLCDAEYSRHSVVL